MSTDSSEQKTGVVTGALREHRSLLAAFVRSRAPQSRVDDILQSAALRAIEGADSLQDPEKVLPWLYRIHRNIIVDGARSNASHQRMLDKIEHLETAPPLEVPVETCACSRHLAKTLPSNYSKILELVDLGDSTLKEAARKLEISTNNATVRLHRARKALRDTMVEHCGVTTAKDCANCRCVYEGCCPV